MSPLHSTPPPGPDLRATRRPASCCPTSSNCAAPQARRRTGLAEQARFTLGQRLLAGGRIDPARLEADQFAAHGYAWLATYATALREMLRWAERLAATGRLGEVEQLMLQAAFGEYLAQMAGGIALSQAEIARPADIGLGDAEIDRFHTREVDAPHRRRQHGGRPQPALVAAVRRHRGGARARRRHPDAGPRPVPQVRRREDRPARAGLASRGPAHPARPDHGDGGPRRLRPDHPGELGRPRHGQGRHVRRNGGAVARLARRRLAGDALRDRRRADPRRRHRGAEAALAAGDRLGRGAADRDLHRAGHRLRPRQHPHPRA